jgi:hypothetical protein
MDDPDVANDIDHEHRGHIVTVVVMDIAYRPGDGGVVDQHVETSLFLLNDLGGAPDRVVGRDVELDEAGTPALGGRAALVGVSGANVDRVSGFD